MDLKFNYQTISVIFNYSVTNTHYIYKHTLKCFGLIDLPKYNLFYLMIIR